MARPSDTEYALRRKIKDLENKNIKQELEIRDLKKKIDKIQKDDFIKVDKKRVNNDNCPDCNAPINNIELPHANMKLCKDGCGWRKVVNK